MPPKAKYFTTNTTTTINNHNHENNNKNTPLTTNTNTAPIPISNLIDPIPHNKITVTKQSPVLNKIKTNKVTFVHDKDEDEDDQGLVQQKKYTQNSNSYYSKSTTRGKYSAIHDHGTIPSGRMPDRIEFDLLDNTHLSTYARLAARLPWWLPPKALFLVLVGSVIMGMILSLTLRKIHNKLVVAHCVPFLMPNVTASTSFYPNVLNPLPADPFLDQVIRHTNTLDAHLMKENAYFDGMTADLASLKIDLIREIEHHSLKAQPPPSSASQPTTNTIPLQHWYHTDGYFYALRLDIAAVVKSGTRLGLASDAAEKVVYLRPFLRLRPNDDLPVMGFCELSPNGDYLALAVDRSGNERFDVYIWDIVHQRRVGSGFVLTDAYYTSRWISNTVLIVSIVDHLGVPRGVDKVTVDTSTIIPSATLVQMYWETALDRSVIIDITSDMTILIIQSTGITVQTPILISVELAISGDWSSSTGPKKYMAYIGEGVDFGKSEIQHHQGYLYIRTNFALSAVPPENNMFEILRIPFDPLFASNITQSELIAAERVWAHSSNVYIEKIQVFQRYLCAWTRTLTGRRGLMWRYIGPGAINTTWKKVMDWQALSSYSVSPGIFTGQIGDTTARVHQLFDTSYLQFTNSSTIQKPALWELDLSSGLVTKLVSSQENSQINMMNKYALFRVWVNSAQLSVSGTLPPETFFNNPSNGEYIPVDLAWKYQDGEQILISKNRDSTPLWTRLPGTPARPVLVMAYGAYGAMSGTQYNPSLIVMMDHGVVIAQVHPRGDGDLGPLWYTAGMRERKVNTFTDVETAIAALQHSAIAERGKVALLGRSAGGLAVGTAAVSLFQTCGAKSVSPNSNRLLWSGVSVMIAQVPFVDMLTSAVDPNHPWTLIENQEWGDMRNVSDQVSLTKISPYQNLQGLEQCYATVKNRTMDDTDMTEMPWPMVVVTAAKSDTQIAYTEPLRWVARLRYVQALALGAVARVSSSHVGGDFNNPNPLNLEKRDTPGSSKSKCRETTDIVKDRPVLLRLYNGGHSSGTDAAGESEWMSVVLQVFGLYVPN